MPDHPAPSPALPEPVARYRAEYRAQFIPAGYRGGAHALFTFGVGGLVLLACLLQLRAVQPLEWLVSANVAWLFIASGLAYFLNYEFLHAAYHLPEHHPIARLGLVRRLRWLHRTHHDPRLMAHCNFNITYPLGDWLFGTLRRDGA